jgi:hypothetical protein
MAIYYPRDQMEHPLVEEPAYLNQQQRCSLLADVGSQMAKDWQLAGNGEAGGEPGNKNNPDAYWDWSPASLCDIDNLPDQTAKTIYGAEFKKFRINPELIWNTFSSSIGPKINTGPAAFTAIENGHPHTAYLCFRGTLNAADGIIDGKAGQVPNPLDTTSGGKTHQGFSEYFQGCGIKEDGVRPFGNPPSQFPQVTLYERLIELESIGIKHLVVTGHSLGSAVGTLATALANTIDKDGAPLFETVRGSVSASPRVGNPAFKEWFDRLQDKKGNDLGQRFWRLRNTSDGVPDLPPVGLGYTEVGFDVTFTADYHTSITPEGLIYLTEYEISKGSDSLFAKDTDFVALGAANNLVGTKFIRNDTVITPAILGDKPGSCIIHGWQANPNHNPCCCYSYAINHPIFTFNKHLNAGNESQGGSCHFPIEPPRKTSGGDSPPS